MIAARPSTIPYLNALLPSELELQTLEETDSSEQDDQTDSENAAGNVIAVSPHSWSLTPFFYDFSTWMYFCGELSSENVVFLTNLTNINLVFLHNLEITHRLELGSMAKNKISNFYHVRYYLIFISYFCSLSFLKKKKIHCSKK